MKPRFLAAALYLFYFAAGGAFLPYLNLYYQTVGMSKAQIGVLIATSTITGMVVSPLWSALADAFKLHRYLLPIAIFGTLLPLALLTGATQFLALWLCVLAFAFFSGPIVALADNAVMEILGGDRAFYGKLRLWGAVGYGLTALIGGVLAEHFGITTSFAFALFFMLMAGVIATRLPSPGAVETLPFGSNLRHLLLDPLWLSFLLAVLLVAISSSFIQNFYVLYLTDLGAGEGLFGLSVAAAGLTELPVFFFSGWMMRRITPRGLLALAFLTFALRSLLISVIPSPDWAIVPQLMHGLSFSAMWAAGVVYVREIAPLGLGATAQSVFGLTFFGIGGTLGGLLGATLYDVSGAAAVFQVGALTAFLGLCLFGIMALRLRKGRLASAHSA